MADYDRDGLLDVFISTLPINNTFSGPDALFHNEGSFTFSPLEGVEIPTFGRGADWIDYDKDGDLDILALNTSLNSGQTIIYQNRQELDPQFAPTSILLSTQGLPVRALFSDWGDYDNDGDLDLIIENKDDGVIDLWTSTENGELELFVLTADSRC